MVPRAKPLQAMAAYRSHSDPSPSSSLWLGGKTALPVNGKAVAAQQSFCFAELLLRKLLHRQYCPARTWLHWGCEVECLQHRIVACFCKCSTGLLLVFAKAGYKLTCGCARILRACSLINRDGKHLRSDRMALDRNETEVSLVGSAEVICNGL